VTPAAADEHLAVERLGDGDLGGVRQLGIVDRHVAPAEQHLALVGDALGDELFHVGAQRGVLRHEDVADRIFARGGQGEAQPLCLADEELVRDLHQHAGAVAHLRVGADGATMGEVVEDPEPVLDDAVRLPVVQVYDEADAAGIALVQRIVEALRCRSGGERSRFGRRAHARTAGHNHSVRFHQPGHARPLISFAARHLSLSIVEIDIRGRARRN
jgi:hypothetical protein